MTTRTTPAPEPSPTGPMSGIRIVDMTSVLYGPFCTQHLGDLGADVIKVEGPAGDITRNIGPTRSPGMASTFLNANRNKRSIAVDLKRPEGRDVVLDLLRSADVFVSNIRRKAMERLGLDYAAVAAVNPGIIYCSASGFGEGGPYEDYPAFDDTVQAASGIAAYQASFAGKPQYVAEAMADKVTGLTLALAIVAAVRHRDRTGVGQALEVPMFETMVAFNLVEHLYGQTFEPAMGPALYPRVVSKFRRPYQTTDGYLAVMPYTDSHWLRFFELSGRPELAQDPRFATIAARTRNVDALYETLSDAIATRSTSEWMATLRAAEIPAVPVKSGEDLLQDPHLVATGFFRHVDHPSEGSLRTLSSPIRFSKTAAVYHPAPRLGEHSAQLLRDLGYPQERIDALFASAVISGEGR